jgi:hypothetical protein
MCRVCSQWKMKMGNPKMASSKVVEENDRSVPPMIGLSSIDEMIEIDDQNFMHVFKKE